MKLEQIDTSTTSGKAQVMQLAAAGRKVAARCVPGLRVARNEWMELPESDASWDWRCNQYAIIVEPVGPDEVWAVLGSCVATTGQYYTSERAALEQASFLRWPVVRYVRADP